MSRTMSVRRATPDDAAAIAHIVKGLGSDEEIGISPGLDTVQAREWIERLGDQGVMVIAEDGSIPAAFGSIDFNATEPDTAILGVWVLPGHRRRGIATQVAEELLSFARENGYRRIRGRLPEGNEPALSFLSAIGAMVPLGNPEMTFELPL